MTGGRRALVASLTLGAAGVVGLLLAFLLDPGRTFYAYFTGYTFALSLVHGAAIFLMICYAMNATWPMAVRRLGDAVLAVMPLLAVLYLPIFFGYGHLYPWMHPESVTEARVRELLEHRAPWLNLPFFAIRSIVYLAFWVVACALLRRASLDMDRDRDGAGAGGADGDGAARAMREELKRRLRVRSAVLLVPMGLTITFAAFDWWMTLSPDWYSTMFGVYYFAGSFLGALALLTVLLWAGQRAGHLEQVGRPHYYALGRLLLSFVIFWAYIAYFQFFLVWIANKPTEVPWYLARLARSHPGPRLVSQLLVVGHFFLPFLALLPYRVKRRGWLLAAISLWLLVAHYFDVHWLIAPETGDRPGSAWVDLAALLGLGGACVAWGLWRQKGHPLVPVGDPDLERALAYESH
jgi:hypothetical protein